MQRLGRKGHPTYRVVVQDSRQTPTSGKYVALLGSYDPHSKTTTLSKDKAEFYLKHGAQPSDRVARLFTSEGVALPSWVKQPSERTRDLRNPDKLRKNRPAEEKAADEPEASSDATVEPEAEAAPSETPVDATVAEDSTDSDAPADTAESADAPEEKPAE